MWVLLGRVEESGRTGDEEKVSWFLRRDKCIALESGVFSASKVKNEDNDEVHLLVIGLEPLLESDVVRYRLQKSSSSRL